MSLLTKIKNQFSASMILAGTILGAAVFSLPYVFVQSGLPVFVFYLIFITIISTCTHLVYGESLLRTKGEHRFVGLAEIYLGPWAKKLVTVTTFISIGGSLLAYLILGGQFIQNFSQIINYPIDLTKAVLIFWFLGSLGVLLGIKLIGLGESIALILIMILVVFFFVLGIPNINFANLNYVNYSQIFLPYGILLFALSGGSAVPEIYNYFSRKKLTPQEINFKKPLVWGSIIPAIIYLMFVLGVVGILGLNNISFDIVPQLIEKNYILGIATNLLGIFLIITSYFILALSFKNTLKFDLHFKNGLAWFFPLFLPISFYFLGVNNFITIIGFLGAAILGIESLLNFLIHKKAQEKGDQTPPFSIKISNPVRILIVVFLIFGAVLEIIKTFSI